MPVFGLISRICLLLLCLLAGTAQAQREQLVEQLDQMFQTGTVQLTAANARMEVPAGWKFMSSAAFAKLYDPEGERIRDLSRLGFLTPATASIADENLWWVTVSSFDEGYIAIDSERVEPYALTWRTRDVYKWASRSSGGRFEFVNYGRAPELDSARNLCSWTERIRYPDDSGSELLDIYGMALSRRGGLIVEAEYMPDEWQDAVEKAVDELIRSVRFNIGERYEDHNPADPVADYELSHIITGEFWLGPQTWTAWLQEPVKLGLGKGWKKFKIGVPNWLFWGGVSLVALLALLYWLRSGSGGAERNRHVGKVKGARR